MKTILLVLPGSTAPGAVDYYQVLQEETAIAEAASLGLSVEVVHAPGFDHLRIIRKRLADTGAPGVDAVVVEPGSLSSMELLLKEVKGRVGLILLNAWSPAVEEHADSWGAGLPFGTLSTDHVGIGRIQALEAARRGRLPRLRKTAGRRGDTRGERRRSREHGGRAAPAAPLLGDRPARRPPRVHPTPALSSLERGLLKAYGTGAVTRSGHWRASWS